MYADFLATLEGSFVPLQEPDDRARATPVALRVLRCLMLFVHLIYVWLVSVAIMPWLGETSRRNLIRAWSRQMLGILGIKVELRGRASDGAAALIVANHISWTDMYVLNAVMPCRFVAKSEVAQWPIVGTIAKQTRSLFIVRGHRRDAMRVKNRVAAALRSGDTVGLFPEGTTGDGTTLKRFFPAIVQGAIDAGVDVQPVALRYLDNARRVNLDVAYADDVTLPQSIMSMLRHRVIYVEVALLDPVSSQRTTRREVTRRARREIAAAMNLSEFEPPCQSPEWASGGSGVGTTIDTAQAREPSYSS